MSSDFDNPRPLYRLDVDSGDVERVEAYVCAIYFDYFYIYRLEPYFSILIKLLGQYLAVLCSCTTILKT